MEEIKRSKEEEANPSVKKKLVKEVKGVVDEAPRSFSESDDKREILKGINNENKLVMKEGDEGIKRLPHQEVPQTGDFSSEALEHL
ncbi:hypothetical protein WN943_010097 [Citrus x changshan-huyou]